MNKSVSETLNFYCENELDIFKQSDIYLSLSKEVEKLGLKLICIFGKEKDNIKSNDLYISISILNEQNEFIEIWDEGFLTTSTILVSMDKKGRIRFFSWEDKEFLEDINWIIYQLERMMIQN